MGFFKIGSQELFAWGWFQTLTVLISASRVAWFTGMSHQRPADNNNKKKIFLREVSRPGWVLALVSYKER
jgi:hypothetical protein